jgi:UDP-glucose 4-epimerase
MIFITGIAGFVGSNLANELYMQGYDVAGCDNLQFGYPQNIHPGIKWSKQDISDISEESLTQTTTLVHCATANIIYSQDNPIDTFKTNALKSFELIKKFKGKIVYTSTASVYGNAEKLPTPEDAEKKVTNAYDQSKLLTEMFLNERGNYTTLRLSNVYGKNQRPENPYAGVVAKFIQSINESKPVEIIGDGLATRDYTYYKDTISAIIKAIELPALNTEVNISSGIETSIINLAFKIYEIYDLPMNMTFIPKRQIDGIERRWMDTQRAHKLLDWKPEYTLTEGLTETINGLSSLQEAQEGETL